MTEEEVWRHRPEEYPAIRELDSSDESLEATPVEDDPDEDTLAWQEYQEAREIVNRQVQILIDLKQQYGRLTDEQREVEKELNAIPKEGSVAYRQHAVLKALKKKIAEAEQERAQLAERETDALRALSQLYTPAASEALDEETAEAEEERAQLDARPNAVPPWNTEEAALWYQEDRKAVEARKLRKESGKKGDARGQARSRSPVGGRGSEGSGASGTRPKSPTKGSKGDSASGHMRTRSPVGRRGSEGGSAGGHMRPKSPIRGSKGASASGHAHSKGPSKGSKGGSAGGHMRPKSPTRGSTTGNRRSRSRSSSRERVSGKPKHQRSSGK